MIIWKGVQKLIDSSEYGLNLGVLSYDDYKGVTEKLVKTESFAFNDSYVYKPKTYQGYPTNVEFIVRNSKKDIFIKALRDGNRISLPREEGKYREYYIDGAIQTHYYNEDFVKLTVPVYFNAFIYNEKAYYNQFGRGAVNAVNNIGDVHAEAVFTIRGNGDLIFSVNGVVNKLRNAQGGYIVNCKNKEQNVTDLRGEYKNVTSEYTGEFPILTPGHNNVQLISGDSLSVYVNWRWRD